MLIGRFALGFAAKRVTPGISLAVLFGAAQLADLFWPIFLALGIEHVRIDPGNTAFTPLDFVSYPYSHSLVALVVWGVAFGLVYRAITRENGLAFLMIAALVVSHWVLDVVTHRPDMPIYPNGPRVGLSLWNSPVGTLAVDLVMYAAGLWMYLRATRARDGVGRWALIAFAGFMLIAYGANAVGGPPASLPVLYISAIVAACLLMLWSWWADRHREAVL